MASAADDQSSKPAAGAGYPPPATTGYTQHYPPGYPPPPHYHGYPPPPATYPGYPNPHNAAYPYTAPPPAAYYSQQYLPAPHQEPSARRTFVRFILTMMIVLLIGGFAMSLLTWLIFGADIPVILVQSLNVPTFNVTNKALKANWDANITVKNSNSKLDIFFQRLEGVIVYEDTILALSAVEPFHVGKKEEATFSIKLSTINQQQESLVGNYDDLVRDRNNNDVSFDLRMIAATMFRSDSLWRRQASLRIFCEDLEVRFNGSAGPGSMVIQGDGKDRHSCLIYA